MRLVYGKCNENLTKLLYIKIPDVVRISYVQIFIFMYDLRHSSNERRNSESSHGTHFPIFYIFTILWNFENLWNDSHLSGLLCSILNHLLSSSSQVCNPSIFRGPFSVHGFSCIPISSPSLEIQNHSLQELWMIIG